MKARESSKSPLGSREGALGALEIVLFEASFVSCMLKLGGLLVCIVCK